MFPIRNGRRVRTASRMNALVLGLLLLLGFFGMDALGERLVQRLARWPLRVYGAALAVFGMEIARYDHGHTDWFLWICFVGAPVVVIFGGAAAGARKWYGWPDLGPTPGRMAAVGAALLAGVLLGTQVQPTDVAASKARGAEVAAALRAWKTAHAAWPATIDEAMPAAPRTRMGSFGPPAFAWDPSTGRLSFPVGRGTSLALDVAGESPDWRRT